jgi:arginine-tRNA-protein transferase
MSDHGIRLFLTAEHPCGYFPDRQAKDLLLDPHDSRVPQLYTQALGLGFRRSGGHVYRPRCRTCEACQPLRLDVLRFRPDRSQRRCLRRNADISALLPRAQAGDEHYALYRRYVRQRHPGGGMDAGDRFDFDAFVSADWSPTQFAELRLDKRLVAVAVTDVLADSLSAVYTFCFTLRDIRRWTTSPVSVPPNGCLTAAGRRLKKRDRRMPYFAHEPDLPPAARACANIA